MTARKFSADAPRNYFSFLLRQNWPSLVTNAIVLFILDALVLSFNLTDSLVRIQKYDYVLLDILGEFCVVNVVVASLLAVLWGTTTMSYLNSKVGVHFYHSLPLTRTTHYFLEIGCKILWFVLPMGAASVLGYFTTGTITGHFEGEVLLLFMKTFLFSVTFFIIFYSIMIFAASFTGTGFARLLAAGMIVFMPWLLITCFALICDFSAHFQSVDWMYDKAIELLLPVRAISVAIGEQQNTLWSVLGVLLTSVVFLAAGVLIYKKRPSERSGTPVIFSAARGIMKYATLFAAATVLSIGFELFDGGLVGIVLGALIGALLAMMLMNTILTKSAKSMFIGMKGFVIFCVCFFVIFALFGLDLIGMDTYVPDAAVVRKIDVSLSGSGWFEVEITDREDIADVTQMVREYLNGDREETSPAYSAYAYEKMGVVTVTESIITKETEDTLEEMLWHAQSRMEDGVYVRISFRTVGGFRVDKRYNAYVDQNFDFFTLLANSENFRDAYFGDENAVITGGRITRDRYNGLQVDLNDRAHRLHRTLRDSYNGVGYFNRPLLSTVYFDNIQTYWMPYFEDTEEAVKNYLETVTSICVINTKTGEMKMYDSKREMEDILSSAVMGDGFISAFTPKDDTYFFFGFIDGYCNYNISGRFLKNHVPALPALP